MVVVLTYWLSYEYVRNPREALEPAHAQGALLRGAHHTLHLLAPYLAAEQRRHLLTLSERLRRRRSTGDGLDSLCLRSPRRHEREVLRDHVRTQVAALTLRHPAGAVSRATRGR